MVESLQSELEDFGKRIPDLLELHQDDGEVIQVSSEKQKELKGGRN